MPTYDYGCPSCGSFEAIRSISARNEAVACPDCGTDSPRVIVSATGLAFLDGVTRKALETNERASHEPKSSKNYVGHRHPAGCGCCSTSKKTTTVRTSDGNKLFPSKRPWMISH
jgi:putative FmdB family regulatory protein